MEPVRYIPPQFDAVRDSDEQFFWTGKPEFFPFLMRGLPLLLLGLAWGALDYFLVLRMAFRDGTPPALLIFFALHLMPLWIGLLNFARLWLVHHNTWYAVTNKRIIARSGFLGIDFKSVDFDKISDIEVTVNPLEYFCNVGTIRGFSGRDMVRGNNLAGQFTSPTDAFISIHEPYRVFKLIKETTVNVKTDWNYPNALRPETNPGYRTRYEPEK